ncbi:GspE/PulE family protein [Gilvimarinus sp. SDUM040013]|uniref:GspE/PulE family protein n=1 Tax=Gilvimarinus gilvus TaxID=3058038 RepID=A0ABU4RWJ0_9GAMM|nr:GspE/PulE family protein [Gilvimarinus sp. SDUM040013]MDO3385249.1 GspE/PulE family protein [Gilvimarinus sp. SDUM040013]MDX6849232.1 GspE/PulE family protein [Gilvimarinus sp. SDUM040013]
MRLGDYLLAKDKLSSRDVERALLAQKEMGGYFGQVLIKLGVVSELDVYRALSELLQVNLLDAHSYPEEPVEVDGISEAFLSSNAVVPVRAGERYEFAATCPQDPFIIKGLSLALGKPVVLHLGLEADINTALSKRVATNDESDTEVDDEVHDVEGDLEFVEHLKDLASEAPVIRLVNQIIHKALDMGASDVHIEPFEDKLHLRYRVDGVIQEMVDPPPLGQAPAIASRIKLLSKMNIAERRLPQDGRIMTRVKGHELDLRVSTIPTVHGESIVMRVLDRDSIQLSLESMGFAVDTLAKYQELLARPHGVLLVTGPTGSGKTTTLYASLATLDASELKIITVEDPVEYQLAGVNQIQVQSQIDLTFARSLRAILRQDPDIIMIGEMRDGETAQIAVQSALTGHLVLSTLHTNTAAGAITRLEDMGIERYLITSSVNGVLAQRLVRTLCKHCKVERPVADIAPGEYAALAKFIDSGQTVYRPGGCELCKYTGYKGRTAIHELFVMTGAMHRAVQSGADATKLHATARSEGMLTLFEDGLRKVAKGETSLEEVLRVTQDQSEAEEVIA